MRISIIGHSGSGKSTLARNISKKCNIPHLHIDRFWFESGGAKLKASDTQGKERVRNYIQENVENFIKQDSWVSDGWYSRVQPLISERADSIIFLDIPLYHRLFNHVGRVFIGDRHTELTRWDDLKFIYEIIRRTFVHEAKLRKFVDGHSEKVKVFTNYKQVEQYLNSL